MTIAPGTEVSTFGHFDNRESGDVMNDGTFYIYGNWNNDGLVSFTPVQDTGNTLFQGMYGKQQISGNMPSDFYHRQYVEINISECNSTYVNPSIRMRVGK